MVAYAELFADRLMREFPPATYRHLVEIASNDGLLLRALQRRGYEVLGVEPSNLARDCIASGLPVIEDFFDHRTAQQIAGDGGADLIVARNVIGHSSDLRGFLEGLRIALRPGGRVIIESPYVLMLNWYLQYDTIFGEHASYFSIATLRAALATVGLYISSVNFVALNGGSFICTASGYGKDSISVEAIIGLENQLAINSSLGWVSFADRVASHRSALRELLGSLTSDGSSIWVYGAAAKTIMLLNYCGIDRRLIEAIADNNEHKQGLYAPGVDLPIRSPAQLAERAPDYVMIGPANISAEIRSALRSLGYIGNFIEALPAPRLADGER
jgi:hypothetical protein